MVNVDFSQEYHQPSSFGWLLDLVTLAVLGAAAYYVVTNFAERNTTALNKQIAEHDSLQKAVNDVAAAAKRHDELQTDLSRLRYKLQSLETLIASNLHRFSPLIGIEHLQNFRPEGLWFNEIAFSEIEADTASGPVGATNKGGKKLLAKGYAFNHSMIARFLSELNLTKALPEDATDLRTLVFFSEVHLRQAKLSSIEEYLRWPEFKSGALRLRNQQVRLPNFAIDLTIKEKNTVPANSNIEVSYDQKRIKREVRQ